ncbi:MAG: shikimate dehydrogenase [Rhodobacteraceae bacterium]|nr:shikimate dehydrogenase [Paracoccaceae bacterium]MBL4810904.1 shikimate dehydrogenase [Paracoccaceae bacterium]
MALNVFDFDDMSQPDYGRAHVRVGLIGHGIQLSRTPAMHVAEGAEQGVSYSYDLIDLEVMKNGPFTLSEILDAAEAAGFSGCNVTYPFKKTVIEYLDILSSPARRVGAVNTVVFKDGKRTGHNTDYWGFAESLRHGLSGVKMKTVLLLGAGGAGGAVAHALKTLGVENLLILDTSLPAAETLASTLGGEAISDVGAAVARADGIVNATPMGMVKLPGAAIPTDLLKPHQWVSDIVYFPRATALLRAAKATGCQTLDGSSMAVFQAARAFKHFTGLEANVARMRATFEAFSTN